MRSFLKVIPLVCVLLFGATYSSFAADAPDASEKVWANYHQLDQELTDLYQKILISLDNEKARENLTNSENSFLDYRKTQGVFVAMGAHGETPSKPLMVESFTATTEARIAELKKWQASQSKK